MVDRPEIDSASISTLDIGPYNYNDKRINVSDNSTLNQRKRVLSALRIALGYNINSVLYIIYCIYMICISVYIYYRVLFNLARVN
jgi:hypothetical protein